MKICLVGAQLFHADGQAGRRAGGQAGRRAGGPAGRQAMDCFRGLKISVLLFSGMFVG